MKHSTKFTPPPRKLTALLLLSAVLACVTLPTGPAMAQQTGTITLPAGYSLNSGAAISVNPTATWDAAKRAWLVSYSVNIDIAQARFIARTWGGLQGNGGAAAAEGKLDAVYAKYGNRFWFRMRYANTHTNSRAACIKENPAAYLSGWHSAWSWSRRMTILPREKTCLTVWIYGNNPFSPEGTLPLGSAYFVAPAAP